MPINKIKIGIQKFGEGDYTYHIPITTKDEFEEIANSFKDMSKKLIKLNQYYEHHAVELEKKFL